MSADVEKILGISVLLWSWNICTQEHQITDFVEQYPFRNKNVFEEVNVTGAKGEVAHSNYNNGNASTDIYIGAKSSTTKHHLLPAQTAKEVQSLFSIRGHMY